jgi:superoxide dismutase
MPQYGLNKLEYITAFFNNINWELVEKRYAKAIEINN